MGTIKAVRLSRLAAVVALIGLMNTVVWTQCLGWQPTAQMRAACCKVAQHPCTGHNPDDCCARQEGSHQASSNAGAPVALAPPPAAALPILIPPGPRLTLLDAGPPDRAQHVARYVLLSVFLV
jgi:hypothetical protein